MIAAELANVPYSQLILSGYGRKIVRLERTDKDWTHPPKTVTRA